LKPDGREQFEREFSRKVKSKVIMSTKLFVGNLSFNATENQLQDMFAAHGNVLEVDMIMDKFTGRPRGFAFVTMENKEGADAAVQAINGKSLDGRALTVNEARPREERPRGGGGGGGYGGGRGGGGGYRGDRGGDRGGRREYSR
jgi:cold-inducible RNA-binding protein